MFFGASQFTQFEWGNRERLGNEKKDIAISLVLFQNSD